MAKINKKQIISYENSETLPKFANSNELCPRKNGVHRGIYLPLTVPRLKALIDGEIEF